MVMLMVIKQGLSDQWRVFAVLLTLHQRLFQESFLTLWRTCKAFFSLRKKGVKHGANACSSQTSSLSSKTMRTHTTPFIQYRFLIKHDTDFNYKKMWMNIFKYETDLNFNKPSWRDHRKAPGWICVKDQTPWVWLTRCPPVSSVAFHPHFLR